MKFLFGKQALIENINSINKVYLLNRDNQICDLCQKHKITISYQNQTFFNQFNKHLNHQYIVSEITQVNQNTLEAIVDADGCILMIDELQDAQNFGAIIRTAEALGIKAIVYKKNNQVQINDFVVKASMGAINNIPLIRVVNLLETINFLKKNKYWIYCSVLNDKAKDFQKIKYDRKSVLIVGNEQNGVSNILVKNSDFLIHIPMIGKTKSLNVSVATGILLQHIISSKGDN